jgi:hypothetical protein
MAAGPVRTPLLQMSEHDVNTMRTELEATGIFDRDPVAVLA